MLQKERQDATNFFSSLYDILITKDNLLRKINELLDFQFIYDELKNKYSEDKGRTAYDPIMMFKYLMLKVIYELSDVDVVERSFTDMSFKYFLGLAPDAGVIEPSSLTRFRKQRIQDMDLLDLLIAKTIGIAMEHGLIKTRTVIVDATHTGARCNPMLPIEILRKYSDKLRQSIYDASSVSHSVLPAKNKTDDIDDEIAYTHKLLDKVNKIPLLRELPGVQQKVNLLKEKLEDVEELGCSSIDPDAKTGYKSVDQKFHGYKTHIAMTPERLIVAATITSGEVFDGKELPGLVDKCNEVGVQVDTVVADAAYSGRSNLEMAEERDIKMVAKLNPTISNALTDKRVPPRDRKFVYNKDADRYECPAGHLSSAAYIRRMPSGTDLYTYRFHVTDCRSCPRRRRCLKDKQRIRRISVSVQSQLHKQQMAFQQSEEFRQLSKQRYKIEAKNAELKNNLGYRRAISYGLASMKLQGAVTIFVANIKRILKIQ